MAFTREEQNCAAKLENRKAAGADKIVNSCMRYGGEGMLTVMVMLYNWIWKNEYAPKRWRKGVVVNLFKKGDKAEPIELPRDNAIKHRRQNIL